MRTCIHTYKLVRKRTIYKSYSYGKKRSLPHTTHVHSYTSTYINSLGKKNKNAKTKEPSPDLLRVKKKVGTWYL